MRCLHPMFPHKTSSSSSSADLSVPVPTKILSRSSAEVSPSRSAASAKSGEIRTELSGDHSLYFLDLSRSPAAAWRSTSAIGRRILSPAMEKAMLASIKITKGELSDTARENVVIDYPRDFFSTDTKTNFSCTSPGVSLLMSMARSVKSPHTRLNFLLVSLITRIIS